MFKYRLIKLSEIIKTHKLTDSLSPESKRTFVSYMFGRPHRKKEIDWIKSEIAIILSLTPLKILLSWWGKGLVYFIGVFYEDDLVGFCYLFTRRKIRKIGYEATFGIAVKDSHQGSVRARE